MDCRAAEGARRGGGARNCTSVERDDQLWSLRCGRMDATSFPEPRWPHAAAVNLCAGSRQAFLDRRGEEYDDWFDKDALIVKAQECEVNTGRATDAARPQPDHAQVTHVRRPPRRPTDRSEARSAAGEREDALWPSCPQRVARRAGRG